MISTYMFIHLYVHPVKSSDFHLYVHPLICSGEAAGGTASRIFLTGGEAAWQGRRKSGAEGAENFQGPYFTKLPLICSPAYMFNSQRSREIAPICSNI